MREATCVSTLAHPVVSWEEGRQEMRRNRDFMGEGQKQ